MKKYLVYPLIVLCSILFGQNSNLDSLRAICKDKSIPDTVKIKVTLKLAGTFYSQKHYLEAYDYYKNALKLAQKSKALNDEYTSYVGIGNAEFHLSNLSNVLHLSNTLHNYYKALEIIKKIDDKKESGICLINIAGVCIDKFNFIEAHESLESAMKIMKMIGDKSGISNCYLDMEILYRAEVCYIDREMPYDNNSIKYLADQYADSAKFLNKTNGIPDRKYLSFQNGSDKYAKSGNSIRDSKTDDDIILKKTGISFDYDISIVMASTDSITYESFDEVRIIPLAEVSSYHIKKAGKRDSLHRYYPNYPFSNHIPPETSAFTNESRPIQNKTAALDSAVIILKSGDEIKCIVREVNIDFINYIKSANGPSYNIKKEEVFMIKYANGSRDVFVDKKIEPINNNSNVDMYQKGVIDANKYYTGRNCGENVTIVATCATLILGLIPAIACSATEPSNKNLVLPDRELLKNDIYVRGYKETAHKIKKKKIWTMFAIGCGIDIVLVSYFAFVHSGLHP
jgi:tetratricopeptide (TPR) repeat protein